jgi:hypothetical protein
MGLAASGRGPLGELSGDAAAVPAESCGTIPLIGVGVASGSGL